MKNSLAALLVLFATTNTLAQTDAATAPATAPTQTTTSVQDAAASSQTVESAIQETAQPQQSSEKTTVSQQQLTPIPEPSPTPAPTPTTTTSPTLIQAPVIVPPITNTVPPEIVAMPVQTQTAPKEITKYAIRQVIKSKNLVVVESSAPTSFKEGKIFLATFPDGQQCSLSLIETDGNLLTLDSKDCSKSTPLTLLIPIEPALIKETVADKKLETVNQNVTEMPTPSRRRFAANIYFSVADQINFDDVNVKSSSGSGNIGTTFNTDGSAGVGVNLTVVDPNSWGFTGSLMYEPARKISSLKMSGPGGTLSGTFLNKPEISFFLAEAGVIYKWNQFYIPLALNYSAPILLYTTTSSTEVWDVGGAVGAYIGAGFLITENAALEFFIRSIGMTSKVTDGSDSIDFKNGYISGVGFGYKYYF